MDCYKNFADVYDELINEDIDYERWKDFILDICRETNLAQKDYLDLACGTGNMTSKLAPYFNSTWAVDMSSEMLSIAELKLREEGLKAKFACMDICCLNLKSKFDLVTCCLDSSNYILGEKSLADYFKGVYELLKEDGLFIFDINSYYKLVHIIGNNIFTFNDDNIVYIWENSVQEEIVDMFLTFFIKESDELYKRFDEEHKERAYKEGTLDKLLEECGFKIYGKFDNYERKSIGDDTERIVYIVMKKK